MLYGHYAGNNKSFPDFVQGRGTKMIENWHTEKYHVIYADPPWEVMAGSKEF